MLVRGRRNGRMGEVMFMRRRIRGATIARLFCLLTMGTWPMDRGRAQEASDASSGAGGGKEGVYAGLTLRGIGPALMSGRVGDIAVDPVLCSTATSPPCTKPSKPPALPGLPAGSCRSGSGEANSQWRVAKNTGRAVAAAIFDSLATRHYSELLATRHSQLI